MQKSTNKKKKSFALVKFNLIFYLYKKLFFFSNWIESCRNFITVYWLFICCLLGEKFLENLLLNFSEIFPHLLIHICYYNTYFYVNIYTYLNMFLVVFLLEYFFILIYKVEIFSQEFWFDFYINCYCIGNWIIWLNLLIVFF